MTLVSLGILNLVGSSAAPTRSIQFECEGAYTGIGLVEAQIIASGYVGSLPTGMTDFYGYSAGSTIVYDFSNSITWAIDEEYEKDGYQALVFTGRVSGDIITLEVNIDFIVDTNCNCQVWYSINSTSSWSQVFNASTTTNSDIDIPGVDYNDVVRIRVNIFTTGPGGAGDVYITLDDGFFTSGSGTVTSSGSVEWDLFVYEI